MFSKYKRSASTPKAGPARQAAQPLQAAPAAQQVVAAPAPATAAPAKAVLRRPTPTIAAETVPGERERERKRKERMGEIKIELHRELLENLNLAALDKASEADLRNEIAAIASEVLQEKEHRPQSRGPSAADQGAL